MNQVSLSKQKEYENQSVDIEDDMVQKEENSKPLCDVLSEINNELNENKVNVQNSC